MQSLSNDLDLLVIEDDESVARMEKRILSRNWKSVTIATNCDDGLLEILSGKYDLVLSDWDCPNENDGAKIVRDSTIPVVVYTANPLTQQMCPDTPVLLKPSEPKEINETLIEVWNTAIKKK